MAGRSPSFRVRVALFAGAILSVFVLLYVALNRLGTPAAPAPPTDVAGDDVLEAAEDPPVAGDPASGPGAAPGGLADAAPRAARGTEQITMQLFLVDQVSLRLTPRIARRDAPRTLAARAQVALEALSSSGGVAFASPLPPGTVIREVWVSPGGIAYVDFATGIADLLGGGSTSEIFAVYGVVGTLTTTFPEIRLVQFLVDGQPVETLTGHLDLSLPLGPLADWLY